MNGGIDYYILSKGRADTITTNALLDAVNIEHTVVVEPLEEELYGAKKLPTTTLNILPKNEQGIAYVREYILQTAVAKHKSGGNRYICVLDDDVRGFGTVLNNRCVNRDASVLIAAGKAFIGSRLAQMGLQYRQSAWSATKDFTVPTHCDCVSFFDLQQVSNIHYDSGVAMKEDWDYSLQCLKAGLMTGVFNRVWMSVPSMGSNRGGLYGDYAARRDWEAACRLARKWGEQVVTVKWKNRNGVKVVDCKVEWKYFQSRRKKI